MSINILLLEDDILLGESIQDLLEQEDFKVHYYRNGQDALNAIYHKRFDLYLFDINVPLINGLDLLKELRASHDFTPSIYLTSYQDKNTLSQAYAIGADDYLKKPFNNDELICRIHAILRRSKGIGERQCLGKLCLDTHHKCIYLEDRELLLTPKEYLLMELLMLNKGEVVTKEMIIEALWHPSESISEGSIRVYINRLKHEIGNDRIASVRGMGYRLINI